MPLLRKWIGPGAVAFVSILSLGLAKDTDKSGAKSPGSAVQAESPGPDQQSNAVQPAPSVTPLNPEEMARAAKVDAVTIPTPGEFFAAVEKSGKPNWGSQYRPPTPIDSTSRAQMALNLGTLIADGYIAVEAQDGQQVKNVGKDVLTLAKKLSVSEGVLARSKSITEFAENGLWNQLNQELEATQNEVKKSLEDNRDSDLIALVSIGGWIRGTQVVTGLLVQHFNAEDARLLRQPGLVSFLRSKIDSLPGKLREDKLVAQVDQQLQSIQQMVSFPSDHVPSLDEVKKLNDAAGQLTKEISTQE
jgi:hypothetical protein